MRRADLTWPDVRAFADAGALLVVPLGSTEQHGPHLPLSTDSDIAAALCAGLADARPDVLIVPSRATPGHSRSCCPSCGPAGSGP